MIDAGTIIGAGGAIAGIVAVTWSVARSSNGKVDHSQLRKNLERYRQKEDCKESMEHVNQYVSDVDGRLATLNNKVDQQTVVLTDIQSGVSYMRGKMEADDG